MRGRQVFMESLLKHGVEYIFGNPGSTENAVVDGMLDYPDLTFILALHEGVALGAATCYAQASGKTAVLNLHAAPGLGNAIGMLYGALRANAPMVVTTGQQDTRMRLREPILGHDLVGMAAPVVKWAVQVEHADEIGPAMRRAFKIAGDPPRGPVFVSLPVDVMEQETDIGAGAPADPRRLGAADASAVAEAAQILLGAQNPVIVAGDGVAQARAHAAVTRLAEAAGAPIWFEPARARLPVPTTHAAVRGSLPFDTQAIRGILEKSDAVVMIGGHFFEELWFDREPHLRDGATVVEIEETAQALARFHAITVGLIGDLGATADALAEIVEAKSDDDFRQGARQRLEAVAAAKEDAAAQQAARIAEAGPEGAVSLPHAMAAIRDALPAGAVVVDEAITARRDFNRTFDFADPDDFFAGRGGGIGQGIAGALGVQLATPDRPVVLLSGDGSAMYSIQALWTAAHHGLPIVFLILANREYRVLKTNLDEWRRRYDIASNRPNPHMDIADPPLDFVKLAEGMGVGGTHVDRAADLAPAIKGAFASRQPYLIEIAIGH